MFVLVFAKASSAQTDGYETNSNLRGDMSFGTYYKSAIDNVNLATGTVNLKIPLIGRKGRGLDTGEDVFYSSKLWVLTPVYNTTTGNLVQMVWGPSPERTTYLQLEGTGDGGVLDWTQDQYTCTYTVGGQLHRFFVTIRSNFQLVGTDGAKFQFPNVVVTETQNTSLGVCNQPGGPPPNAISIPTGFSDTGTVELNTSGSTYVVSLKNGRQVLVASTSSGGGELIDTNGNNMNATDTVGRTSYTDSSGTTITYTLSPGGAAPATQFPTTASGCILQNNKTLPEISSIQLPNGQSYTFTYDPNFGEITEVTLPTGGYIKYVYQTIAQIDQNPFVLVPNGVNQCYTGLLDSRRVSERHVSADGVTEAVWQYSYTATTTTVTDPLGNVSVHTFTDLHTGSPLYETERDDYDNASHLLLKTVNTWDNDSGPTQTNQDGSYTWTTKNPRITSTTTTLEDSGQVRQASTTYDRSNTYNTLTNLGNATESRMNVMETDEYDWGPGATGPLLRKTVYDYLHYDNSTYLNLHIWNRVSSKTIYDNASNTCQGASRACAQTTYKYDTTTITPAPGVVAHDYTGHPSTFTTRGNLTETDAWRNTDGAILASFTYYDELGNVVETKDPKTNPTLYSYADSWATGGSSCAPPSGSTAQAYKTQVTDALGHLTKYSYYSCSSLTASATDPNNQTTSWTYDHLDRVATEIRPDTGQTSYTYNDPASPTTSNPVTAQLQSPIGNGATLEKTAMIDGLGRVNTFELNSDPTSPDYLAISYDPIGRVSCETNPYRTVNDPTYGTTCTTFDPLGRPTKVTKPDGGIVTTSYSGNCTTVTDEAGKTRESCTDGLGRVSSVVEDPGHLGYTTNYTYDALGNLLSAVQGGSRQRSFVYNSLSQLLTSTNPESGTVTYTYDNDGNVATKKDARGITATYSYNAINQVLSVTYSNGDPTVSYTYDEAACLGQPACYNLGHRTTMTDAAGTEHLSYDKMGHELTEQRTTNTHMKTTSYTYNLLGEISTLTYPSGRIITYTYDSAGRPSDAQDVANSINYVVGSCANGSSGTGVCYAPNGAITQMQNGSNLVSTYIYDNRFEPCWMYATTGATPLPTSTACNGTESTPGNILDLQYNFNLGAGDNGNVMGITNKRDTTRSESFVYDALNRIASGQTSATTGSNCWGQTYTIDEWGNLTNIGHVSGYSACSQGSLSVGVTVQNQLTSTGFSYDAAGNMLTDGANTYTYNAESEITSVAGVTYTYDGDGNRVEKSNGKLYWYGPSSEVLTETDLSGNVQLEMVYFGGRRVAHRTSSNVVYYYEGDMLSSARTIVQAGATSVCYDADFLPFGGERDITNTCSQNYKFEGKKRDTETGNDDFGARFYRSNIGRWMSADWSSVPAPVPYANLTNPQTLNLYAMVSDNPETFADLDGHEIGVGGGEVQDSQTLADNGQPAACALIEGCAEYEVQYADGPEDTSQDQSNAEARDDSSLDGTTQQQVKYEQPQNEQEAELANVIYNETSSLRPDPNSKPGQGGSAEALHDAREAIGEVAERDLASGHPNRVAPTDLKDKDRRALNGGNLDAIRAHNDSLAAAREALSGANRTKGDTQYRLRDPAVFKNDPAINGKTTNFTYGLFLNTLGVPQGVALAP